MKIPNFFVYLFTYCNHTGTRTNPTVPGRVRVVLEHTTVDSFLEFEVLEMSDSGTYVCVVSNSAGTRESSIVLEVEGIQLCTLT